MRVRRLVSDCCGMHVGGVYDAVWDIKEQYVIILFPDGPSSPHRFPGFFEIVS